VAFACYPLAGIQYTPDHSYFRSRVGRGHKPSTCLLLYNSPLGAVARHRLRTLLYLFRRDKAVQYLRAGQIPVNREIIVNFIVSDTQSLIYPRAFSELISNSRTA